MAVGEVDQVGSGEVEARSGVYPFDRLERKVVEL